MNNKNKESEVINDKELANIKFKAMKHIIDFGEFHLFLSENLLDGMEPYFKQTQITIIDQAYAIFRKIDIEEPTIQGFINCIKEQISLSPNPKMYVGLLKLSEDYLLQQD